MLSKEVSAAQKANIGESVNPALARGRDNAYARLLGHLLNRLQKDSERGEWLQMIFKQEHLFNHMCAIFRDTKVARISRHQRIFYLRDTLADPKVGLLSFTKITLPYDAEVAITGILPGKLTVYKSTAMPVRVSFITTDISEHAMIVKAGDDMRIDVFVLDILRTFNEIWHRNGFDMKLTIYRCMSLTLNDGILEYIPSEPLSAIIARGTITSYLASSNDDAESILSESIDGLDFESGGPSGVSSKKAEFSVGCSNLRTTRLMTRSDSAPSTSRKTSLNKPTTTRRQSILTSDFYSPSYRTVRPTEEVLDTFLRSCAGYSVFTYIMGIGDRHLDNLLLKRDGHFFHIDFAYIFGADPKPFPPPMKLCKEMIEAMGGPNGIPFKRFKLYSVKAFVLLRQYARLITAFISLCSPLAGGGAYVEERLMLKMDEWAAARELERLIDESMTALFPKVFETLHKWAQYWRQ